MTVMTVMYTRRTGHPLGALTTTVPGDPPALGPSATAEVRIPIPGATPALLTVRGVDLIIAVLEAEFTDPLQVFQWRVVTVPGPDGRPQRRLDKPSLKPIIAKLVGTDLTIEVPRLGNETELAFDVRDEDRHIKSDVLRFGLSDTTASATIRDVKSPPVVLVQGYPIQIAEQAAVPPVAPP